MSTPVPASPMWSTARSKFKKTECRFLNLLSDGFEEVDPKAELAGGEHASPAGHKT